MCRCANVQIIYAPRILRGASYFKNVLNLHICTFAHLHIFTFSHLHIISIFAP